METPSKKRVVVVASRLSGPGRAVGWVVVVSAVVLSVLVPAASALAEARGGGLVVDTHKGAVRGFRVDGVDKFLGIPYAAAPVGELRWRPPAPAPAWPGVRSATVYGNRCAQLESGNGPRSDSEDCLYLNVYRPSRPPRHRGLPVLFWIHGGGLLNGASNQHDGALLAHANGIVVVSINYRLGVFGFLALPSLSGESGERSSGDYGMLDPQAALRWTR